MSKVKRLSGIIRKSWYGGIGLTSPTTTESSKSFQQRRPKTVLVSDILKEIFAFVAQPNQQPFGNLDRKTYQTLYSCLLVNRQWCQDAVQVLWRQPFYSNRPESQIMMMDILLDALNPKLQQALRSKIPIRRLAAKPAFDYAYFIKQIDFEMFIEMVRTWSSRCRPSIDSFMVAKTLLKFLFSYSPGIERLRLSCFQGNAETARYYEILMEPELHASLLQLRYLEIAGHFYNDFNVLAGLSISCKNVEYLHLGNWCLDSWCRSPEALNEDVTTLFRGFKKVELLEIDSNESFIPIPSCIIDSLTHISNSLRHIRFRCIDFSSKTLPLLGLASCRKLEILDFIDCDQVGAQILTPLNAESLPNLSKVRVDGCTEREAKFWDWVEVVNGRRR
ncbi:hypothetical protein G9A89_000197 [Geosiphon pyriformis]|nr:hypothetical protein G9A89_000197 [Geosiphon pyriformis]